MRNSKKRLLKKLGWSVCFIIVFTMIIGLSVNFEVQAKDNRVKQITTYDNFIKKGSVIYCTVNSEAYAGIYKVNLKTSKVKRIMKYRFGEGGSLSNMYVKKGYIYYTLSDDLFNGLYRVETNGKNKKLLAILSHNEQYAVSGSAIFFKAKIDSDDYDENEIGVMKKMSLDGRNKKRVKGYRIKMSKKKTNAKGYKIIKGSKKIIKKSTDGFADVKIKYYLRKPNGKRIYLDTLKTWTYVGE